MRLNQVEKELIEYYNWSIEDIKKQRKEIIENKEQIGAIVSI